MEWKFLLYFFIILIKTSYFRNLISFDILLSLNWLVFFCAANFVRGIIQWILESRLMGIAWELSKLGDNLILIITLIEKI